MNVGKANGRYIWPRTLRMPTRPPKLVYLDLNHWINLARTYSGDCAEETDKDILDFCFKSVEEKVAVFPLSLDTYIELQKTGDYQKRRNLREVIERISQYVVVLPRHVIAAHENEAVLDQIIGSNPEPINSMNYLDHGACRAAGLVGGIRVMSGNDEDITEEFRRSYVGGPEAFDKKVFEELLEFERRMIEGPPPEEEPDFRDMGYDPQKILDQYEWEAKHENELVRLLDKEPVWRCGRLRDVVSARELYSHINSTFKRGCDARGACSLDEIFPSIRDIREAFDSMPSFDVSVTLKTLLHKDAKHHWNNNDIHDLHALAVTLPYCDIVITDRAMASRAMQSGLADRLNTVVLSCLSDLRQRL